MHIKENIQFTVDFFSLGAYNNHNRTPHTSHASDVPHGETFFYRGRGLPMQIKVPTSYEEQIRLIQGKGFLISQQEEEACIRFLNRVNYYRLSAYFLPFRKQDGSYVLDVPFSRVQRIYEFDGQLRGLVFSIIEDIEVNVRAILAYYVAHHYGPLGYLNSDMFSNKHQTKRFQEKIQSCIEENARTLVVKHHKSQYDGQFPIWVIIEFFSVGMLSYFYRDLHTKDKKAVAAELGTVPNLLESWLRCLTDLRNKCAHYSRLYYWAFAAIPNMPKCSAVDADRTLFSQLLMLKYLYPVPEKWTAKFVVPLKALMEEYQRDISLEHIGFPSNWEALLDG